MSGGSYNYMYRDDGTSESLRHPQSYRSMAEDMAKWPEAQSEMLRIARALERAGEQHRALADVMKAVEWHRSGDWGEDSIDEAVAEWLDKRRTQ